MELTDTHCHLNSGDLAGRIDEVMTSAAEAGVTRLIDVACSAEDWVPALQIRARYADRMWLVCGIHPHDAAKTTEQEYAQLDELWRQPGMVACGEMGLDYHYDFSPRPVQQAVFARQLAMAASRDMPIVIHSREAHADVVRLLLEGGYHGRRVVFHCFSGTCDEAAEVWSHGWWTSFTGTITFKNAAEQQQVCMACKLDQLMFETDAPYLSPEPVRRVRPNEPRNMVYTVRFAADLRKQSFEELAEVSTANARRFFGLP